MGKKKKRKGEHHIRKWQITTRNFNGEPANTYTYTQDNAVDSIAKCNH